MTIEDEKMITYIGLCLSVFLECYGVCVGDERLLGRAQ